MGDEFAANMKGSGPGARILERTCVGGYGREQAIRDAWGDLPTRSFEQTINQFARGRIARRDPVQITVARVALVMVNIDERFSSGNERAGFAEALEAGAIRGNDTVEFQTVPRLLEIAIAIEKPVFLRHPVLVPARNLFALGPQRQGQAELRADAIAVGPDMAQDANGPAGADGFEDSVNDFRVALHHSICRSSARSAGFFPAPR